MYSNNPVRLGMLMLLLCLAAPCIAASTDAGGPAPELGPADVVRLQLTALRDDNMNAGIRQAYRYASPDNRRIVGSASDFARMLRRRYADMLTQTGARVRLQHRNGDRARVLAELEHRNGRQTAYVFLLSRQHDGDCEGCWMTDGVIALKPENNQPLYSI